MITNINTLQNLPQSAGLQTYSDLYLKQSLSNLGQRFSVKGDGIQTGEFSLYELFDREYDTVANANSYAKITVKNELIDGNTNKFNHVISLSYIDNGTTIETIPLAGNSYYRTVEDIELDGTPINHVHHYASNGIISKLDNEYITLFKGLTKEDVLIEYVCDNFVINVNNSAQQFYKGVRFYESSYSGVVRAIYTSADDKFSDDKQYSSVVYESYIQTLEEFAEQINSIIANHEDEVNPEWLISELTSNGILELKYSKPVKTRVINQGSGIITFYADWGTIEQNQILVNEYDQRTISFGYDTIQFLPYIESYYNSYVFFGEGSNMQLKKRILVAIVEQIFADYLQSSVDTILDKLDIWLPYNYKFVYRCNSNSPDIIYNSINDISLEYTEDALDEIYKLLGVNSEQMFVCSSSAEVNNEERYAVYHYAVTYIKNNIVDDIVVTRKYTLPYIDKNGYWCINDIPTSIYARGKDGGQPNIIMTYTDCGSDIPKREILSSLKRDELSQLDWEPVQYRVRPLDNDDNPGSAHYHIMTTYMPVNIESQHENLVQMLENAVILNINSIYSEVREGDNKSTNPSSLVENLGKDGVIPTFWVLQKVKDKDAVGTSESQFKYQFSYIQQPGEAWAVDMNYLSNAEGIVKHYMNFGIEPDNYEHTWLVFDKISTNFKNSTTDNDITVWPVFRNLGRVDFTDMFGAAGGESTQYTNDLNMVIGFYDHVTKTNGTGYINGVSQESQPYLSLDANHQIGSVINYSYYPTEFIPNAVVNADNTSLVPTLDLKEVFVRNENVLNRLNVIAVNSGKYMYNAYFGTAYDATQKDVLHIGTSSRNINVGNTTLISRENSNNFGKFVEFDIDFDEVYVNGNLHVKGGNWTSWQNANGQQWSMTSPVSYVGRIPELSDYHKLHEGINSLLLSYSYCTFKGFSIGPDDIPDCFEDVSLLNLTYYLTYYSGMAGFSDKGTKKAIITGDSDHLIKYQYNDADIYYLKLTTNINSPESELRNPNPYGKPSSTIRNVITNPIQFAYMINETTQAPHINVREVVTDISNTVHYNIGTIEK